MYTQMNPQVTKSWHRGRSMIRQMWQMTREEYVLKGGRDIVYVKKLLWHHLKSEKCLLDLLTLEITRNLSKNCFNGLRRPDARMMGEE